MFRHLNRDLIIFILEDFLNADTLILSALDVACCNAVMRAELLAVLPAIRCAPLLDYNGLDCFMTDTDMTSYLVWLGTRGARIPLLVIWTADIDDAAVLHFAQIGHQGRQSGAAQLL